MCSYCIMARKTRRRTQKRSRRRRGKSARKRRSRRRQRGGASCGGATESQPAVVDLSPPVDVEDQAADPQGQNGGRRRRKTAKKGKKGKKGKRKLNAFFKVMLKAKKAGAASFQYKGKTYKGRKHHRLGMLYKKA